jgi:putative oxidoreductase
MEFLSSIHQLNDLGLLLLRVALGAIFLVHGKSKWAMWKMQPSEQMPAKMLFLMKLLSIAEPTAAIALFFGFLTQLTALGLAIIMLGASMMKIRVWHAKFTGNGGWEFDLILLTASLALFFLGAGGLGIDRYLFGL